jgi:hypothetical protein
MAFTVAAPPVDVVADVEAEVAGADDGGADVDAGADELAGVLGLLPPHAAAVTASPVSASALTRVEKCR